MTKGPQSVYGAVNRFPLGRGRNLGRNAESMCKLCFPRPEPTLASIPKLSVSYKRRTVTDLSKEHDVFSPEFPKGFSYC